MNDSNDNSELQGRLNALERQLAALSKHRDLLLYTLSHDLRTPLMTILGFTDILLADLKQAPSPHINQQYLDRIRQAARRQLDILERLHQLTQLQQQALQLAPTALHTIVSDCLQELSTQQTSPLVTHIEPTPQIHCDATLMRVALHELLTNAMKFTRNTPAPSIAFGAEQVVSPPGWRFHVRDNGMGFDAAAAKRLFQVGQRLHTQQGIEGAGMGLVIAAGIIERHGGRIWVESQPGHGATVYFTLGE